MRAILQNRASRRRGSILIVVIVTLLITAIALTLFIEKASDDLLVETRELDSRRLRKEAFGALETTLCVLNEFRLANGSLRSPSEGWSNPLEFAGYTPGEGRTIQVEFLDESGKMSLPRASTSMLVDLFKSWEIHQADAEKLADALLEWSKNDYIPSSGFSNTYDLDHIPFGAPGRPPRSYSELAAIDAIRSFLFDEKGRPNLFYQRFVDSVSLLDFQGINLNSIRPGVLDSLGVDSTHQQQMRDYLSGKGGNGMQGPGFFRNIGEASSYLGTDTSGAEGLGVEIKALRIIITVREGPSVFRLNTVVTPAPGGGAKAITTKAAPKNQTALSAAKSGSDAGSSSTQKSGSSTTLNYPFAILEIRENDELPKPNADNSASP
jgi:general secretion pathway protein K